MNATSALMWTCKELAWSDHFQERNQLTARNKCEFSTWKGSTQWGRLNADDAHVTMIFITASSEPRSHKSMRIAVESLVRNQDHIYKPRRDDVHSSIHPTLQPFLSFWEFNQTWPVPCLGTSCDAKPALLCFNVRAFSAHILIRYILQGCINDSFLVPPLNQFDLPNWKSRSQPPT